MTDGHDRITRPYFEEDRGWMVAEPAADVEDTEAGPVDGAVTKLVSRPRPPTDISPEDRLEPDRSGEVLSGRYRLIQRVGIGGAGSIYRAVHTTIGREVAVKVLHGSRLNDRRQVERFLRESQAAARIKHENVIQVLDHGESESGAVYLVMEWLDGEDLGDAISRESPFPWKRTKQVALQICRALHAAHTNNVLHRDLKPENCFRIKQRANRDFIKLIDFGVAKIFGDETDPEISLTKSGSIFGTPAYMSPEQARGHKPDHRTDIYALGVMIYEMLTGSVPFYSDTAIGVLVLHVSERPEPPSVRAPGLGITPQMDNLVLRALAKDPESRYADIREFAETIASVPVPANTSRTRATAEVGVERHGDQRELFLQRLVWALTGAVVLLAIGLVLALTI